MGFRDLEYSCHGKPTKPKGDGDHVENLINQTTKTQGADGASRGARASTGDRDVIFPRYSCRSHDSRLLAGQDRRRCGPRIGRSLCHGVPAHLVTQKVGVALVEVGYRLQSHDYLCGDSSQDLDVSSVVTPFVLLRRTALPICINIAINIQSG